MRKYFFGSRLCHKGPVEVIKNLFCGSEDEVFGMVSAKCRVDTLIPLYALDAEIWERGFRGEILYYPIKDYGTLPDDVLEGLAGKIISRLKSGKKVGIFCMGGHGRTGYVAAVVLGKLGYDDPIAYLRNRYCGEAVESDAQVCHIADMLGKPELAVRYTVGRNQFRRFGESGFDEFEAWNFPALRCPAERTAEFTCVTCGYFSNPRCPLYENYLVYEDSSACNEYIPSGE